MGCGHSCEHCAVDGTDAASSSVGGPYRGLTLALLAGYFFLFPVGCAIAAAALTRSDPDLQTAVSLLSFGAAMLFTAGSVRLWARCRAKETDHG
jgi:cell division protein FtsW (lipid II flippase)